MSNIILHLQDVYKKYGQKTILNDIDLEVSEGEFVSVVGPSGCGKSTLLRLILGQEHVTRGQIFFNQEVIEQPGLSRGIVYQKYGLFPNLTVLENVILGKRLAQNFFKNMYEKVFKTGSAREEGLILLKKIGMEQHANKYPHELSGGMQQRVAIAQALIMKPSILMMDEPFGALDPGTRENLQLFLLELWDNHNKKAKAFRQSCEEEATKKNVSYEQIVSELNEEDKLKLNKMTIFFVTHDLEEALFLGTRLLVVSQFYSDLNQQGYVENQGSKIVGDYALRSKETVVPTSIKERGDFGSMIAQIRAEGFDPKMAKKVQEFNLKHPDSFATFFCKTENNC